jgi:hypothetical protein
MAVTYSKEQRELAKRDGLHLVTISAGGVEYQAPVPAEEMERVKAFIMESLARRRMWLKSLRDTPEDRPQ